MSGANEDYAVRIRGVVKSFGRTPVLRGIDLDVPDGRILSLVGSNGSGKTTLLKILATLSKPDSGQILIGGFNADKNGDRIRARIGVVTHDPLLYDDLTGRENLKFFCRMFGVGHAEERLEWAADQMGMTARLDQRVGSLSHGMKKRFSIARALLHGPRILLMDEPESGLDQEAVALLDAVISDRSDPRRTVIMTTHNFERAVEFGDALASLEGGRVVFAENTGKSFAGSARHDRTEDGQ
ncbi:MAG: ABC transporter ATP-binding protein [Dehalococcoidia bacterium]|nr:ABC transporter ATP-binding protein [Dehalococcoidia bacterium]